VNPSPTQPQGLVPSPTDVESAIRAFTGVLAELQDSHADLASRAERVEAELCRTNEELTAILSSLPTGVVVRNADARVVRVNEAALAILDCSEESLLGQTDWPGLQGSQASGETHEFVRADRKHIVLQNRYSTVRTPDGVEAGSVEILDDRTTLQAMTERLHESDKMAALGTMAGGIAHEIRNPLNAVKGFAALLAEQLPSGSKHVRWAGLIQEGVDECNAIIGSMLTFADPERLQLETIQARELVGDALAAVRRDLVMDADDRRYEFSVEVDDLRLIGDRIKLRQALRNLIANAVEAQPQGGAVLISVTELEHAARLRVTDAGPGIPHDLVHRVCDPFFTTRAEGTGLGLALVHTIARLHGGALEIAAEPAQLGGADVAITIPKSLASDSR